MKEETETVTLKYKSLNKESYTINHPALWDSVYMRNMSLGKQGIVPSYM